MTRDEIERIISENIRTNGRGEITAVVMAGVLHDFVSYTDTLNEDFQSLVNTLADAFTVLVEQMEGDVETKMTALETAFEDFTTDLLDNHFEPWANQLATALQAKMDDVKAAALAAKTAAEGADSKAGEAKDAALQAKAAADDASTKAGDAKDAALLAKAASEDASTKSGEAKAAALDASGKATDAKTAAQAADAKAALAKASADEASTKSGEAKTAALEAKAAINSKGDGIEEALEVILAGNQDPAHVVLPDGVKFTEVGSTTLPAGLDFSQVRNGDKLFSNCENLTELPSGLNLTTAQQLAQGCYALVTISGLTVTAPGEELATDGAFSFCSSLENVSDVSFDVEAISFRDCSTLTAASLAAIVNGLVQGTGTRTLEVSSYSYDIMDQEGLVAAATAKGWTVVSV